MKTLALLDGCVRAVNSTKNPVVFVIAVPEQIRIEVDSSREWAVAPVRDDSGKVMSVSMFVVVAKPRKEETLFRLVDPTSPIFTRREKRVREEPFLWTHKLQQTICFSCTPFLVVRTPSWDVASPLRGSVRIAQAFDSGSTHVADAGKCVDMEAEDTRVFAVDDGVIQLIRRFAAAGPHPDLFIRANCAVIKHSRGGVAWYSQYNHIAPLATIKNNQHVAKGELIGHISDVGFTTGPHLCFGCRAARKHPGALGFEIRLKTVDGSYVEPKKGMVLTC